MPILIEDERKPTGGVTSRQKDLEHIKDWLKKQPHLPNDWDDECIMSFLRGCGFSLERTKSKLDMFFTMKTACPEFFTDRDFSKPELQDIINKACAVTMPGLTPEGRRVSICSGLAKDLEVHHLTASFKIVLTLIDIVLFEETDEVTGDVFILDGSVVSPRHIKNMSLVLLKKFLTCFQFAYPAKLKEVHVVNTSPVIDLIYTMLKPFLKEKLKNRIHFHKELDTLRQLIPKDMLPLEYGGTAKSITEIRCDWMKKAEKYSDWTRKQEALKADESLRLGPSVNYDELFGTTGSFRQLSID